MTKFPNWTRRVAGYCLRRDNHSVALHVAFIVFALVSLFLTFYLTPWRDEAQAWLLARDLSPWGLFLQSRHDGHPILWHLCLKFIQAFGINYQGMFVLNWFFITAAIGLLFYRSSLPLLAKIAVAFCPVCLIEVACNARNYAISAALIFAAAALYPKVEKKPILFSVLLALLASTNVYAAAVFVGMSFQFILEQIWSFGRGPVSLHPIYTRYLVPNLILIGGALLVLAQLAPVPLPGEPTVGRPVLEISLDRTADSLWFVFLAFPALAFFTKNRGFPRILGGIPTLAVVMVPVLLYGSLSRHAFMIVLGIIYFLWIYLDDIIVQNPLSETRVLVRVALLIILVSFAAQPGGFRNAFKHAWDARKTAQAIIDAHLDTPETLMVVTEPDKTTSILMLLKNIRTNYGPPPYPAGPLSFSDFFYTRIRKDGQPTLEDIKPMVQKLASDNPDKTIMVVSSDPRNTGFNDHDPNYNLIPIYASPAVPADRWASEFFQVFVLKR